MRVFRFLCGSTYVVPMNSTKVFTHVLGISAPWRVTRVNVDIEAEQVDVHVAYRANAPCFCPTCGCAAPRYDKRTRRWRHLDMCEYKTIVTAEIPRVACPDHGIVLMQVPWAGPGSSLTRAFEARIVSLLQETSRAAAARQLKLSWSVVDRVYTAAVARGLERRDSLAVVHVSVDEVVWQRPQKYVTVVSDAESGAVLRVSEGRRAESLGEYYALLTHEERAAIQSVSMDMWDPYILATREWVPGADQKICFDKFHVAMLLGFAVDEARRAEHSELRKTGDSSLKATRFLWLRNPLTMPREQWARLNQLRNSSLRTAQAWGFKELVMSLWHYVHRGWARRAWDEVIADGLATSIPSIQRVAKTLRRYLWGIINAIVHNRTNAKAESTNARIKMARARACGYGSLTRFRTAIYFHCGRLDLSSP